MKKYFVALLFLAQAPLVSAGVTVYNTEAAFLTQLQPNYYLENFDGYTFGNPLDGTKTSQDYGPENGYSWTASTLSGVNGLYSLTESLSTYNPTTGGNDVLKIDFTGTPVTALGGIFESTGDIGNVITQLVTITLSDGTIVSFNPDSNNPNLNFRGFTSTIPITWLTIEGIQGPLDNWPALGHFYVGLVIPEPASLALLGLGGLLLAPWRRYMRG